MELADPLVSHGLCLYRQYPGTNLRSVVHGGRPRYFGRYGQHVGSIFSDSHAERPGSADGCVFRPRVVRVAELCRRIVVERTGNEGHCFIGAKGVRLIDVKVTVGSYNDPAFHPGAGLFPENPVTTDGGCLLHMYRMGTGSFSTT